MVIMLETASLDGDALAVFIIANVVAMLSPFSHSISSRTPSTGRTRSRAVSEFFVYPRVYDAFYREFALTSAT